VFQICYDPLGLGLHAGSVARGYWPGAVLAQYMSLSESDAPACAEKARLLRLCALVESHYQCAVREFDRFIGKLKKSDYEELLDFGRLISSEVVRVDTARTIVAEARQALERHTAEHGC
jgi:hypothetical protein